MAILLNAISIILVITGIIYHNTNLFWLAGMLAIIAILFLIYSMVEDRMPEPIKKKPHSFTIVKTNPMDMSGLRETLINNGIVNE